MKLNLSADEVLTSTRAVRKRLDFDTPVPMDVITDCLEQTVQAPTGSKCSLITVGYSIGTEFKKAKRPPVQTIMHVDGWGAHPEIPA